MIKGAEAEEAIASTEPKVGWGGLLRQSNTWFMVLGAFGIFYTVWVYLTWLPSYLQTARGFSLSQSGWLASLPFLCGIIARRLRRMAVQPPRQPWHEHRPARARSPSSAAPYWPRPRCFRGLRRQHGARAIALLSLGYFASQVPIGCLWTLASDVAPSNQVASLGAIQNFGGFVGAAVAPVVTGAILTATGATTRSSSSSAACCCWSGRCRTVCS